MHRALIPLVALAALSAPAAAQAPTCDKLNAEQEKVARELLASEHPYDCCDDTLAACLKQKPVCPLVQRLVDNVCRRVADGQDADKIRRGLSRRARSMMSMGKPATIDLSGVPAAGEPSAPVVVVEYACARCPYCAKLTPQIYDAVTKGALKGKARLYLKTFPIRSHAYSKETGLGFVAASELGKFWEFAVYSYEHFGVFCLALQGDWAEAVGMDRAAFEQRVAAPATRAKLVASKKEGIVNKVEATPTFFLDGRRYVGHMDLVELIDVIEEEYERVHKASPTR